MTSGNSLIFRAYTDDSGGQVGVQVRSSDSDPHTVCIDCNGTNRMTLSIDGSAIQTPDLRRPAGGRRHGPARDRGLVRRDVAGGGDDRPVPLLERLAVRHRRLHGRSAAGRPRREHGPALSDGFDRLGCVGVRRRGRVAGPALRDDRPSAPNAADLVSGASGFGKAISFPSRADRPNESSVRSTSADQLRRHARPPWTIEFKFQRSVTARRPEQTLFAIWQRYQTALYQYYVCRDLQRLPILQRDRQLREQRRPADLERGAIIDTTTWHDFAATFDGTTLGLFIDGASVGTVAVSSMIRRGLEHDGAFHDRGDSTTGSPASPPYPSSGSIDEFLVSDYIKYTVAGYTPATAPFTPRASTVFLAHFESIVPANGTPDAGPNYLDGTLQGGTLPTIVTPSPWYVAPRFADQPRQRVHRRRDAKARLRVHVVDSDTCLRGAVSRSRTVVRRRRVPGDYISSDAGGATGHPYTVFAERDRRRPRGDALEFAERRRRSRTRSTCATSSGATCSSTWRSAATDAYMTVPHAPRSPTRRRGSTPDCSTFFEFGNETWNLGYNDNTGCRMRPMPPSRPGTRQGFDTSYINTAAQQWYAWRAHDLWSSAWPS